MSVLFTFPGQGAQRADMLHALPNDAAVAATLAETAGVLQHDPLLLDTAEALDVISFSASKNPIHLTLC